MSLLEYLKKKEEKLLYFLCVLSPVFNVYFNNVGIFVFQVMEESHQQNRSFMAGCRALLQGLQTVSSPHHIALLAVSFHCFVRGHVVC